MTTILTRVHRSLNRYLGGTNLEVFKFGIYIMFPIGWMYYFGTNLESRFTVPDFWPTAEGTHKIPFEKEELAEMGERLKRERLERRRRRLEREGGAERGVEMGMGAVGKGVEGMEGEREGKDGGTFGRGSIERWARGEWR